MTDIAVQHIIEARGNYGGAMTGLAESGLFICTRNSTQILFKKLGEHMAFSDQELDATFESLFASPRKSLHAFFEDRLLNPE